ncbi:hypothetical protein Murru_0648 [Allomuricauda ruestringensis DSM 13258]|uniref:Uncharacterized protein n=2 Tax=Flagellimonas TaxID=444459 RepID=G2PSM5_ALLRU|nr:hypothetical protein Murru_0648 [Allomuricauda ruestringensis DSM 13258]
MIRFLFILIITFAIRFFLQMKRLLLTSVLLASVFITLSGMNAFQKMEDINFNSKEQMESVYAVKYDDCITESDFPEGYLSINQDADQDVDWNIMKVNQSINKYRKSLESTLKNLSTVDAHDFIHQTFQKAKSSMENDNTSEIQKHYFSGIMWICYDKDKDLNQNSVTIL